MTQKNTKNKIVVKALLGTYSVKDISTIFTTIDERILSLHKCSSDDFLRLNYDFKYLINKSKIVSENINEIIGTLETCKSQLLNKEIQTFITSVNTKKNVLDQKSIYIFNFLRNLSDQLRFVFFPIKNYEQNLMGLKYLVANLNLTLSYASENNAVINSSRKIESVVNEIKLVLDRISKTINSSRKISKSSLLSNYSNYGKNETNIESLFLAIKFKIDLIDKRYNNYEKCIPDVVVIKEKSAENISDIIKKLQYQDIIKQKMDHIQRTHKDLISELSMFESENDSEKPISEKAKFFLRIRDIAGLQAAQLIQANKEYQSALEIIINNIIKIGDHMKIVSQTCGDHIRDNEESETKIFNEIIDLINQSQNFYSYIADVNRKLFNEIKLVEDLLNQSKNHYSILKKLNNTLNDSVNSYFAEIEKLPGHDENTEKSLRQVKDMYSDIITNGNLLTGSVSQLDNLLFDIQQIVQDYEEVDINVEFNEIKEIVSRMQNIRVLLDNKLNDNHNISSEVLENIKKSISQIKYYDFFEKTIEEIILELNNVNYSLKVEGEEMSSKEENLEVIKEYYTMETERIVHNQVAKGENIDVDNEEDGEIEFF